MPRPAPERPLSATNALTPIPSEGLPPLVAQEGVQTAEGGVVAFTVDGVPQPKGSTRAFLPRGARFPVVTSDNEKLRPWAALVADAARQAIPLEHRHQIRFPTGPVLVLLTFLLPRPKSLPKRVRWPTRKPDLDKLSRAVLDACTGLVWTDDAQVVDLWASKQYADAESRPGVRVVVEGRAE